MRISRQRPQLARLDTLVVLGISVLSLWLATRMQLAEVLYRLTRRWESLQLDELPVVLLVLAVGLTWLSWRRHRETGRELRARLLAEARLAGVVAENRKLAREHLRIQELERKHLARELHDELGQYLNAIKLDAFAIAQSGTDSVQSVSAARSIIRSIDHVHATVTDMIRRLRPVGLDDLGLVAAIEHCVDQWRSRTPATQFSLRIHGDFDTLDESLTLTLYRLIQEGLTNVHKHAAARQVAVELQRAPAPATGDEVVLTVSDDGRGMDAAAGGDGFSEGFGLRGMRERVEMAGGRFLLEAAPGRGLRFEVRLPWRQA